MKTDPSLHFEGRCLDCGYALRGLHTNACPECGRLFDYFNSRTFATTTRSRHPWIRITLFLFVFSFSTLIALGYKYGDVDDWWWLYVLVGGVPSAVCCRWFLNVAIPIRVAWGIGIICLIATTAMIFYAGWGILTETDFLSGNTYQELDRLIPYVIIIFTALPLSVCILVLTAPTRERDDA